MIIIVISYGMKIIGIQSEVCSYKGHIYNMINKSYSRIWLVIVMLIKMVIIIIIILIIMKHWWICIKQLCCTFMNNWEREM